MQLIFPNFLSAAALVDVIKLFWISPKLKNGKKFVLMSEPALKCENNAANFKQIYPLKLFIAFKIAILAVSAFWGNLDFPEFLKKINL